MKKNNSCCSSGCCGSQQSAPSYENESSSQNWLLDWIDTPAGKVRRIKTRLEKRDLAETIKVRLGINRFNYMIAPGIYAVGSPDDKSPVLVTANYKLTFDSLRKELDSLNLWVLVLDTKGINVWCAAGKGTFGTAELIARMKHVQLELIVSHRTLVLPQLGAPGVASHKVMKETGFKVAYGPVYAADIKRFLLNCHQATPDMRKVHFTLRDRLTVIPVEMKYIIKLLPIFFVLFYIFNMITPDKITFAEILTKSIYNLIPYFVSIVLGTVGIAALLPYLPFRSFALKGLLLGILWAAVIVRYCGTFHFTGSTAAMAANILFTVSLTSFLALNFTGSTTYTSLSGVQKETLFTIPLVSLATVIGLGLMIADKIMIFKG